MRSRHSVLVAGVLLIVAWSMRLDVVHAQASELLGRRIVAIEFQCTAPIDLPGLEALMPMRVGDPLRGEDLNEAQWRLEQKRLFSRVAVEAQPRADGVAVVAQLVRKSIVNSIHFEGNDALSDRELRRVVPLRESMALTDAVRNSAVERMRRRYASEGFDQAEIHAEVRPSAPGEVDVVFRITEGQPLRVAAIAFEGSLPMAEHDVRKIAKIETGDRYVRERQRAAEKAIVHLFRDRHYYEVQVSSRWEPGADRNGILRFNIDPGPVFSLQFSGNTHLSDRKLLDLIDLPKRPIVTDGTWRELARRAHQAYQEKGYYFAKVDVTIEPGPPKMVRFTVSEDRIFHVGKVEFEGAQGLPAEQLRTVMATQPPSWIPWRRGVLLDNVLDDDLKRLWYLYRRHGFEAAEVIDDRTEFDRERGLISITVIVDEKRQTVVRNVVLTGFEVVSEPLPKLAMGVGLPLDREQVDKDRRALLTALARAGYTRATVQAHITTSPSGAVEAATVRFEATPGEQQRVGAVIVQDNFDTRATVIMRELPFRQGDPLNPEALLQGQTNIYKLGIFRSVTVRPLRAEAEPEAVPVPGTAEGYVVPEPGTPSEVAVAPATQPTPRPEPEAKPHHQDVAVAVAGKPPGSLQWGAGYNTRDGFRGFLEVGYDNLQGVARRISLRGDFNLQPGDTTPNEYLGNLAFREPRVDGTAWTFRSNLIAQRSTRSVDQFSLERVAVIPALERQVLPGLQVGMETGFEEAHVFDLEPDVEHFNPRDEGNLRTISIGPFAVYDGRDDPFVPHRGVFDSLRLRVAPSQFGSDIPLLKVLLEHAQYVPLSDDLTFVYVLRGGGAQAYKSHDIVPIRERFFLGGRSTVRGFGENQIGPQGNAFTDGSGFHAGGDPLGGNLVLNANTELRFPLIYGLGGVVFVDGGGVYLVNQTGTLGSCSGCGSVTIHDFRRSTGLGLRYITPVGPVSLDYGFKLDRRHDESLGEVHFSVGTMF